jgi:hypothetical protein
MTWPDRNYFSAEVCERMRRDGGSVFPAHAKTGAPTGPIEACRIMSSHARADIHDGPGA